MTLIIWSLTYRTGRTLLKTSTNKRSLRPLIVIRYPYSGRLIRSILEKLFYSSFCITLATYFWISIDCSSTPIPTILPGSHETYYNTIIV